MIRICIAQAAAVTAGSPTTLLIAPVASAVTDETPHTPPPAAFCDSISWGG
ncbi:hypothetical protein [Kitasatospora sp. NPDC056531]|uniref:hypothetical protein n=1 Tax=Kitasatospora sp. NPDC056531 TaxID=3345856 RepID=UPI0036B07E31